MSRRPRVQVSLDSGDIKALQEAEIRMILRGADELIANGGRNLLVKILKGSKDKKVLEHKLDECPAYGYYRALTMEEISHRVDWMIKKDYIRIDYYGRLPMLVFSEKGWEIEAETFEEEIYQSFCQNLKENKTDITAQMGDVNRQVVFDVLEKIRASKNAEFIPLLEAWKAVEVRKVRERIASVQNSLGNPAGGPLTECRKARKSEWKEISDVIHKTVQKVYPKYYPAEAADFFCMYHSKERIQEEIQTGSVWVFLHDGRIVGTGSREENHITRVYVLPEFQRKGYGTQILKRLEQVIVQNCDTAKLDASLPSCCLYEKLGYRTLRHERMSLMNEVVLVYEVMEKKLKAKNSEKDNL